MEFLHKRHEEFGKRGDHQSRVAASVNQEESIKAFWASQLMPTKAVSGMSHGANPGHAEKIQFTWDHLGISQEELVSVAGDREVWSDLLNLTPPREKQKET